MGLAIGGPGRKELLVRCGLYGLCRADAIEPLESGAIIIVNKSSGKQVFPTQSFRGTTALPSSSGTAVLEEKIVGYDRANNFMQTTYSSVLQSLMVRTVNLVLRRDLLVHFTHGISA